MKKKHHHQQHEHSVQSQKTIKHRPLSHYVKLFFVYLIAAIALMSWINITTYEDFNPFWLTVLSFSSALLATLAHWFYGRHNRVDDFAENEL